MTKTVPPAIAALKVYTKVENTNFVQVFAGLTDESDRSALVISGSVVEDSLNGLLRAHMRSPKNSYERDEIWGPQGVLSNFSQKIKMAYALELIDLEDRNGLDVLREIRNQCAHSMMPLSLKTKALVDACYLLSKLGEPPEESLTKPKRESLRNSVSNCCEQFVHRQTLPDRPFASPAYVMTPCTLLPKHFGQSHTSVWVASPVGWET